MFRRRSSRLATKEHFQFKEGIRILPKVYIYDNSISLVRTNMLRHSKMENRSWGLLFLAIGCRIYCLMSSIRILASISS